MAPSEKTSREAIVAAAFSVLESDGPSALTARRVASELGISPAPLYAKIGSMDALTALVIERARALLGSYTRRAYTERVFINMGTGLAMFAKEHPKLYDALFGASDQRRGVMDSFLTDLTAEINTDPRFAELSRKPRAELLERMWTFTHGLAALVAAGLVADSSKDAIIRSLSEVSRAMIADALLEHSAG